MCNLVLLEHNDNRSCSLLFIGKQKKMNFSYAHYQAAAAFLRVHPFLSLSAGGQYMHFVFAYYHHQDHTSDRPTPKCFWNNLQVTSCKIGKTPPSCGALWTYDLKKLHSR